MFFLKGLLIGIFISLPFGPIGILCLKNIMVEGRRVGFASGLGAATSDIFYSLFVSFGISYILETITKLESIIKSIIGVFLIILGLKIFFTNPKNKEKDVYNSALNSYVKLFVLGLSNIGTIFVFFAIFTTLDLFEGISLKNILFLALGIFSGSVFWWFVLSHVIHIFNRKIDISYLKKINKISGTIIGMFGFINIVVCVFKILKK